MLDKIRYWWRICWGFTTTELYAYPILLVILGVATFLLKHPEKQPFWQEIPLPVQFLDSISVPLSHKINSKFSINPNTITKDSLLMWGLPEFLATNWVKYQKAGGRFRSEQEVQKLYGMSDSIWIVLKDCLAIKPVASTAKRRKVPQAVIKKDINTADSLQLRALYGIGPVLSRRIVKYRNLLGGFYEMAQLSEVYGLDSAVLAELNKHYMIKPGFKYHKLIINSFDYSSLVRHPYLSSTQVKAILAYRNQHGAFLSLDQLKEVHLIDDSTYIKLYPYIDF